jgi:hypothetical protein
MIKFVIEIVETPEQPGKALNVHFKLEKDCPTNLEQRFADHLLPELRAALTKGDEPTR